MAPSCLAPRVLQSSSAAQPGLMLSPTEMLIDKDPEKGQNVFASSCGKALGSVERGRMLPLWAAKFGVPTPFSSNAHRTEGLTCPLKMYYFKNLYNLTHVYFRKLENTDCQKGKRNNLSQNHHCTQKLLRPGVG